MKPDKYGIKTYKVCDSTNTYCLVFDLYIGQTDVAPPVSKYGKTDDLVISLLEMYTEKVILYIWIITIHLLTCFIICWPKI